jgi:arylsulfatase A-like enzyme
MKKLMVALLGWACMACAGEHPNILWIVAEDMSCHFGYQGEPLVKTPNIDRLAAEGVVFNNAYVTAPVCSASRSALITGMYQTSIGAHHHRSSRGELNIELPEGIELVPELFRKAGYYVCNGDESLKRPGKTDYNFAYDQKGLYDGSDWSRCKPNQPFFAQIQLRGGKLRNVPKWNKEVEAGLDHLIGPGEVSLPPYYPDVDVFRSDWADYLNSVQYTDKEVGDILRRLEKDGALHNSVVFFITDHGISQARGKQFLYDEGARIPFVVWAPGKLEPGIRSEPIVHIDMVATSLLFAGIDVPSYMQSRPLFGSQARPREFIVCARDRCDETVDRIRSVKKGDWKYIRNFYPNRPYLQPCNYKDHKPWMQPYRQLLVDGKLNAVQSLQLAETRSEEELYYLAVDPWEINNLAANPEQQEKLRELRGILANWIIESDDRGRIPEPEALYDSDMAAYTRNGTFKNAPGIEANIAVMKQWKAEGK